MSFKSRVCWDFFLIKDLLKVGLVNTLNSQEK